MILNRYILVSLLLGLSASTTWAHGPTPQTAEQRVEIQASPEAVWAVLGNPETLAEWHPDVAAVTMEGEGAGAKRVVEFKSGGTLTDGIDRIVDDTHEIRWRLSKEDIEVFPVSYYTNSVKVEPAGVGAAVTWDASFFRADTTNEPQEKFNDEAAVTAMEGLISHGLEGLKEKIETEK